MNQDNLNTNDINESNSEIDSNENIEKNTNQNINQNYDELNDRYMRLYAEFENYKKRNAKEKVNLYSQVTSDVIISILPVVDNLENALKVKTKDEEFKKGIELILKQLQDILLSKGVVEIETVGQNFDPELHEAISMIDSPDHESQQIVSELRKGYKVGDKVVRHSMVVVAN